MQLTGKIACETYTEFSPFQFDRPASSLERKYTNEASEFVEVGDARIHYRDEGPRNAPTLLALHGTYSSLHTWESWVAELSDEFRLVRLDLPGLGLTGPRADGTHTLSYLIETVGAFCDELSLSDLTVVGSSLGGGIAWRFSTERPDLVSRLVLINAGGATLLSELARNITASGSDLIPRYVTPRLMIRVLLNDAYGDTSKITDELVTRYHDLLLRTGNRRAVLEIADHYSHHYDGNADDLEKPGPRLPSEYTPDPRVWDDYDTADVTVPTLFQWGAEDEWLPLSFGRELAAGIQDATFISYDGVGHVPMEESPETTASDAAAFIRDRS